MIIENLLVQENMGITAVQHINRFFYLKKKDNNEYEFTKDVDVQSREFTF